LDYGDAGVGAKSAAWRWQAGVAKGNLSCGVIQTYIRAKEKAARVSGFEHQTRQGLSERQSFPAYLLQAQQPLRFWPA
jgi:hypothetical protein